MNARRVKFEQTPDFLTFGKTRYFRTYTTDAHCSEPKITGNVISMLYRVYYYTLGAHGNMFFKTFAFTLDPVVRISSLESLFEPENADVALTIIRDSAREQLRITLEIEDQEGESNFASEAMLGGTENWDCFSAFIFDADAIEIHFAPYQVAAYAYGAPAISVRYDKFVHLMRKLYVQSLNIEGLLWERERQNLPKGMAPMPSGPEIRTDEAAK